jgi:hypothetical protein
MPAVCLDRRKLTSKQITQGQRRSFEISCRVSLNIQTRIGFLLRDNVFRSSRTSVNASTPGKSVEERAVIYVPSAGEWEKSAALLVSLQNEVARLNRDKVTLDQ